MLPSVVTGEKQSKVMECILLGTIVYELCFSSTYYHTS